MHAGLEDPVTKKRTQKGGTGRDEHVAHGLVRAVMIPRVFDITKGIFVVGCKKTLEIYNLVTEEHCKSSVRDLMDKGTREAEEQSVEECRA